MANAGFVTEATIREVVEKFYAKVRTSADLAPIFERSIPPSHWPEHIAKICDFWSMIMLGTNRFNGAPMKTHLALPPFNTKLFERWLELFALTVEEVHTPKIAHVYKERAEAIAANFRRMMELKNLKHG